MASCTARLVATIVALTIVLPSVSAFTEVFSIAKDSDDNGYYVGHQDSSFYIGRYGSSCSVAWNSTDGSTTGDDDKEKFTEILYDAVVASDGFVYAVGSTSGDFSSPADRLPNIDAAVVVYDPNTGEALRRAQYDISSGFDNVARAIVQKPDGNLLVVVYSSSPNVQNSAVYDTLLAEINPDTLAVANTYSLSVTTTDLFSVTGGPKVLDFIYDNTSDSVVLLGHILGRGILWRYSLIEQRTVGQAEWGSTFGNFEISGLATDGDGAFFVVGSSNANVLGNTDLGSSSGTEYHAYVIRYDNVTEASTSSTWVRQLAGSAGSQSGKDVVLDTNSNEAVIVGSFDSDFNVDDQQTQTSFSVAALTSNALRDTFLWALDADTGDFAEVTLSTLSSTSGDDRGNVVEVFSSSLLEIGGVFNDGTDLNPVVCDASFVPTSPTPTPTSSRTGSPSPSNTVSATPSVSPTVSISVTVSVTASMSAPPSSTASPSALASQSPIASSSVTASLLTLPTPSGSASPLETGTLAILSPSPTLSRTASALLAGTASPSAASLFSPEIPALTQGPLFSQASTATASVQVQTPASTPTPGETSTSLIPVSASPSRAQLGDTEASVEPSFLEDTTPEGTLPSSPRSVFEPSASALQDIDDDEDLTLHPSPFIDSTPEFSVLPTPMSVPDGPVSATPFAIPTPSQTPQWSPDLSPYSTPDAVVRPTATPLELGSPVPDNDNKLFPPPPQLDTWTPEASVVPTPESRPEFSVAPSPSLQGYPLETAFASPDPGLDWTPEVTKASAPVLNETPYPSSEDIDSNRGTTPLPFGRQSPEASLPSLESPRTELSGPLPSVQEESDRTPLASPLVFDSWTPEASQRPQTPAVSPTVSMLMIPVVQPEESSIEGGISTEPPPSEEQMTPESSVLPVLGSSVVTPEPPSASALIEPESSPEESMEESALPSSDSANATLEPSASPASNVHTEDSGKPSSSQRAPTISPDPSLMPSSSGQGLGGEEPKESASPVTDASVPIVDTTPPLTPFGGPEDSVEPLPMETEGGLKPSEPPLALPQSGAESPESTEGTEVRPTAEEGVDDFEPSADVLPSADIDPSPVQNIGSAKTVSAVPKPSETDGSGTSTGSTTATSSPDKVPSPVPSNTPRGMGAEEPAPTDDDGSHDQSPSVSAVGEEMLRSSPDSDAFASPGAEPERVDRPKATVEAFVEPSGEEETSVGSVSTSDGIEDVAQVTVTPFLDEEESPESSATNDSLDVVSTVQPSSSPSSASSLSVSREPDLSFSPSPFFGSPEEVFPSSSDEISLPTPGSIDDEEVPAPSGIPLDPLVTAPAPSGTSVPDPQRPSPSILSSELTPISTPFSSQGLQTETSTISPLVGVLTATPLVTSSAVPVEGISSVTPAAGLPGRTPTTSLSPFTVGPQKTPSPTVSPPNVQPTQTPALTVSPPNVQPTKTPTPTVSPPGVQLTSVTPSSEEATRVPRPLPSTLRSPSQSPISEPVSESELAPSPNFPESSVEPVTSPSPSDVAVSDEPPFIPSASPSFPAVTTPTNPFFPPSLSPSVVPSFFQFFSPSVSPSLTAPFSSPLSQSPFPATISFEPSFEASKSPSRAPDVTLDEPSQEPGVWPDLSSITGSLEPSIEPLWPPTAVSVDASLMPSMSQSLSPAVFTEQPFPTPSESPFPMPLEVSAEPSFESPSQLSESPFAVTANPSLEVSQSPSHAAAGIFLPSLEPSFEGSPEEVGSFSPSPLPSGSPISVTDAPCTGLDVISEAETLHPAENFQRVEMEIRIAGRHLTNLCEFNDSISQKFINLSAINTQTTAQLWFITSVEDGPAVYSSGSTLVAVEELDEETTVNQGRTPSPSPTRPAASKELFPGSVIFRVTVYMTALSVKLARGSYVEYVESQNIVAALKSAGYSGIEWTGMVTDPVVLDARTIQSTKPKSNNAPVEGVTGVLLCLTLVAVVGFMLAKDHVFGRADPTLPAGDDIV